MNPRELARADQIIAVLREADQPLTLEHLARLAGGFQDWTVRETVGLLNKMQLYGLLRINAGCCILHAMFELPADL